jgi:hypothetical protein
MVLLGVAVNVLVVVDMQADYPAAQDSTLIERIEKQAIADVALSGRVVAVNYDGCGAPTVKLPPGTQTIWKHNDDGGDLVYSWLVGAGLVDRDLLVRFAGVNLTACVFKTATALGSRLHEEHALCRNVVIDRSLCGDGSKYIVMIE